MNYKVITSKDINDVEQAVSKFLSDGWELSGGICSSNVGFRAPALQFSQAIVKYDKVGVANPIDTKLTDEQKETIIKENQKLGALENVILTAEQKEAIVKTNKNITNPKPGIKPTTKPKTAPKINKTVPLVSKADGKALIEGKKK